MGQRGPGLAPPQQGARGPGRVGADLPLVAVRWLLRLIFYECGEVGFKADVKWSLMIN